MGTTIEVTCECGRTYVLPAEKEGRKLQCRRCGAVRQIRRDADPGTVVPFQAPGAEEPPPVLSPSPTAAPVPSAKARTVKLGKGGAPAPLRRCPTCGFKDDPSIVICVRCGLDFRTGERPEDSEEIRIKAETHKAEVEADAFVGRVETLARLGFVPLVGLPIALGGLAVSMGAWSRLRELPAPSRRGLESRLDAARLLAVGTVILWSGVVAWFELFYVPAQRRELFEARAAQCRENLEALGKSLRTARTEKGRFPASARSLREGFEELLGQGAVERTWLACPLLGSDYAIDAQATVVDERTNPEYLVAWDGDPHVDGAGSRTWRALRADGSVEEFRSARAFEKGRARNVLGFQGPGSSVEDPLPIPHPGGSGGFEAHRAGLLALAKDLDARDPELKERLTPEDFRKRVGLAPADAASVVARRDDEDLKRVTARLIARLDVPAPELVRVAEPFDKEASPDVRLTLVLGLRRAGGAWLEPAGALAAEAPAPVSDRALALLVGEATSGREGLARVLRVAKDRRALTEASLDRPIFPLPAATFKDAVELLDDRDVALEAVAVLSRGGPEVQDALDPVFKRAGPPLRELAFRALRASLLWRDASLEPYHERLKVEADRTVKAAALLALVERSDAETVRRALEVFREGGPVDPLANVCRKVLANVRTKEAIEEAVLELDRPGPARDEVVRELQGGTRVLDDLVAAVLVEKAPRFESEGSHEAVVKICAGRFDDAAHRHVAREAFGGATAPLRELALRLLVENGARLSEKVADEVATEAAQRLAKETDPAARERLFALLERPEFRSANGLLALEAVARRANELPKDRERAVAAIGKYPEPRAVTTLVDLIDGLKDHAKWVCMNELRNLTGAPSVPSTSSEWRRLCHQHEAEMKKRLKEREEKDSSDWKDRQRAAQAARARLERAP